MPHDIATSTWSVQRNTENSKRFPAGFWAAMYYIWTIYTWKAIIPFFWVKRPWPFFFVITALIVWSHLCESCYGFLRPFFNKMSKKYCFATGRLAWELLRFFTFFFNKMLKKYGFATGRTAMFFDLTIFLVITGKNNILPTKMFITVFSHNDQKVLCFWLSRYIYIYIYHTSG